jgi:phosphoglycolate phosphatase-like HAD superfamily hydrolase
VSGQRDIRLLLADVDGTLVTQEKVLTEAANELLARDGDRAWRPVSPSLERKQ